MYLELLKPYREANPDMKPHPPASAEQIRVAEDAVQVAFPAELRALLGEMDGDGWLFFSCDQLVQTNLGVRTAFSEVYDGLDELLFVAGNGCGDYYGYRIRSGECVPGQLVRWEHETNQTVFVAATLAELIDRYYSDEI